MYGITIPAESHYTVYKLTAPNGKIYIGQTGNLKNRWGKGYRRNPVSRAIKKYGWKNFKKEILCENLTKEGAEKLEKWFVEYYDSTNPEKGYNGMTGGARKNARLNDAAKERARRSHLKKYEESPAYSENLRYSTLKYYRENPDKKEEVRRRMKKRSADGLNRAFLESSRVPKPVMCIETGEVFPSQCAAERATGYSVHRACAGAYHTSGGYHWKNV